MTANLNADQHDDLRMTIPALPGSYLRPPIRGTEDQSELLLLGQPQTLAS